MDMVKRGTVLMVKILGVAAIAAGMVYGIIRLEQREPAAPAEVFFVGTAEDADCTVLLSRDTCVMIDTGEEQDGERIVSLLKEQGISTIDCLILTHPDKDHIGGAARVMEEVAVRRIITPYYMRDNERYEQLINDINMQNIPMQTLARNRQYQFGDFRLRIYPPMELAYDNDNDYSLVTWVEHGEVQMLFTGDAQKKRLGEMEQYGFQGVNLYKVPHHGRDRAASVEMAETLHPEIAVVTAAEPEPELLRVLTEGGVDVYCTVPNHTAVFVSDGKTIQLKEREENQ